MQWFVRKRSRRRLALITVVIPATLVFFAAFASSALAGNFFATGHDQDFHCGADGDSNECAYYKISVSLVRGSSTLPVLILDRDNTASGGPSSTGDASAPYEAVSALNLAFSDSASSAPSSSSPSYVVEDPQGIQATIINGTAPAGITTASTWAATPLVDGSGSPLWSAIIIASDTTCGGCDLNNSDGTHVDSDAINARTSEIVNYFNAGGGLLYLAGADNAFDADGVSGKDVYYASVPVPVGGQPVSAPFTVTADGAALGITEAMVNCCATHNSFTLPASSSPLKVAETDSTGLAESLFLQGGAVCSGSFCSAKLSATGVSPFKAIAGKPASGILATFSDTNTSTTAADYQAELNWGDGSSSTGTISGTNPNFAVSGSHTYAKAGFYTITVTITQVGNPPNTATVTATAGVTSASSKPAVGSATKPTTTTSAAILQQQLTSGGLATTYYFQYGIDAKYRLKPTRGVVYDQRTPDQALGANSAQTAVTANASPLVPNAVYHARLVATNSAGNTIGPDIAFRTLADRKTLPKPVLGKVVNASVVSGRVFVKLPGRVSAKAFKGRKVQAFVPNNLGYLPLTEPLQLPVGTKVDNQKGALRLVTAGQKKSKTQNGVFSGGLFSIAQRAHGASRALTTLSLLEGAFPGAPTYASCKAVTHSPRVTAGIARLSRRLLQTLRANAHGRFRTRGRYSASTVRGTNWGTRDRCDGTLTIVRRGTVAVRDFTRHKTVFVHAGHRYLAPARRHK
jgi:hypothetical protein